MQADSGRRNMLQADKRMTGSTTTMMSMLRALLIVLVIAAATGASGPVHAQGVTGAQRRGHAFVSNGAKLKRLGGTRGMLHLGFGMEWLRAAGLDLGFEAGPRFEDYDFTRLDDIMLSVDIGYHPRSTSSPKKVDPFLDGGFALGWEPVSDGQQTSFLSLGGGMTYWWKPQRGIRFELRDAVTLNQPQTGYHHLGFRVGYTWLMGQQ
jgi:hypothetical protein